MKLVSLKKGAPKHSIQLRLSRNSFSDYLIAMGVFKSIHEQLDKNVQASWNSSGFLIQTNSTPEEVVAFYQNDWKPLPLFCVWDKKFETHFKKLAAKISKSRHSDLLDQYDFLCKLKEQFESINHNTTDSTELKKRLAHFIFKNTADTRLHDILCALTVPYVDSKGVETSSNTKLGNQSIGATTDKSCLDRKYWTAILACEKKHIENTILSTNHKDSLVEGVELTYLDPKSHWNEQSICGGGHLSRKTDAKKFMTWNGEKCVWGGCPFETMMMIEGMTFFRGRAGIIGQGNTKVKGVDFDEVNVNNKQVPCLPFAVRNNSISTNTGTWVEQTKSSKYRPGFDEIWCPVWRKPMTYRALLSDIRELGVVAQSYKNPIIYSRDMMLFLSQVGVKTSIDLYSRFVFLNRIDNAHIPTLVDVFDPSDDKRVDVIQTILPYFNDIRRSIQEVDGNDLSVSGSIQYEYTFFQDELDRFMNGASSMLKVSLALIKLVKQLRVSWGPYLTESKGKKFFAKFPRLSALFGDETAQKIPALWIERMESEFDTECRIAASLATGRPLATSVDMSIHLWGKTNRDKIEALRMLFEMCEVPYLTKPQVAETPWLPLDYRLISRLFSIKDNDLVSKDQTICRNLIIENRIEDAMEVAHRRLCLERKWNEAYYPARSTKSDILVDAVTIKV